MIKKSLPVIMVLAIVTGVVLYFNVFIEYGVFEWSDLILVLLMLLMTAALMYMGFKKPVVKGWVSEGFRINILFAGFLLSLFRLYGVLLEYSGTREYVGFEFESLKALKPLLIGLLLYFMLREWLVGLDNLLVKKYQVIEDTGEEIIKKSLKSIGLTRREREVADLIYKDMTNKEIATDLYIAEATVKKHVQNILKKAGCVNKEGLRSDYEKDSY